MGWPLAEPRAEAAWHFPSVCHHASAEGAGALGRHLRGPGRAPAACHPDRQPVSVKSDLRNLQAIVQPRLCDCLVVTQITLKTERLQPRLYDCLVVTQIALGGSGPLAVEPLLAR